MKKEAKYNFTGMLISAVVLEVLFWLAFGLVYFIVSKAIPGLRWERATFAWLFLTGPLMFLIFIASAATKNRRISIFSDRKLLYSQLPDISSVNTTLKYLLWRLAAAAMVVALINPQLGSKMTEAKVKGIEIVIAVDVSNSMLAEDLKPNRLEVAKRAISRLLDNLHGDRIGIVVFAGQAFVQLPITSDYTAGKLFLSSIGTDIVPVQGTAIGSAIDLALKSFDFETPVQKAIIVITDGENHLDDPVASAKKAAEKGVQVFTIGMGSINGAPIPDYKNGRRIGYKTDKNGNTVVTKLDQEMLKKIAEAGNGSYIHASNGEVGLQPLIAKLNKIQKTEMGAVTYSEYEDRFQLFLALAAAFLLLEFLIRDRKGKLAKRINLFD